MPETYTKEQIEEAKAQARFYVINGHLIPNECGAILLSALSTAERERKELAEKYYAIRQADLAERNIQYDRAEKAEAQVAELEARLQGAADRLCAECMANEALRPMVCIENRKIGCRFRAAIVGKKED